MDRVIELARVGYVAPRLALLALCCGALFLLGWHGRRAMRYDGILQAAYWVDVVAYFGVAIWAAMTI